MAKITLNDIVIFNRNPGSPLMKDAVRHIGQKAKVIGVYTSKTNPIPWYRIQFSDGSMINAFYTEVTLSKKRN